MQSKESSDKRVRITLELPSSFLRLLNAKATLKGWTRHDPRNDNNEIAPELDAGGILAWLVLMEARGGIEEEIHACTPMMWRTDGCPELIHDERRVYEDGKQISGPVLRLAEVVS